MKSNVNMQMLFEGWRRFLSEADEEEVEEKKPENPSAEERTRLMKALEPIQMDVDKSKVVNALKHIASPSKLDDTPKDDIALGKVLKGALESDEPDSLAPLFRVLKTMAIDKKKEEERKEEEAEEQEASGDKENKF